MGGTGRYPVTSGRVGGTTARRQPLVGTGRRPLAGGKAAANQQRDGGVPPEIVAERSASVRQLARERDAKKKLSTTLSQLRQQLSAAVAERDRARSRNAQLGDPKAKLAGIKDECAMLQQTLIERDAQVAVAADHFKLLEQRSVALEGDAAVHPTQAAKRTAMVKNTHQRVKSDKKAVETLARQEASLRHSVDELRARLEFMTRTPETSPMKQQQHGSGLSARGHHDAPEESLADVQMRHDREKRAAVEALQAELARDDRELERRREELAAAEERERQMFGSQYARIEAERGAAQRDGESAKQQLASTTARADELRKQIAATNKELLATKEARDRHDLELTGLQRQLGELQREIDRALLQGDAAATKSASDTDAWKQEKAQLERSVEAAARRVKSVTTEHKKVQSEIEKHAAAGSSSSASSKQDQDAASKAKDLDSQAAADDKAAATAEKAAADANAEAEQLEQRNALSQRDSIIEQQRDQLKKVQQETAGVEAENKDLATKLHAIEARLAAHGLSVDS